MGLGNALRWFGKATVNWCTNNWQYKIFVALVIGVLIVGLSFLMELVLPTYATLIMLFVGFALGPLALVLYDVLVRHG